MVIAFDERRRNQQEILYCALNLRKRIVGLGDFFGGFRLDARDRKDYILEAIAEKPYGLFIIDSNQEGEVSDIVSQLNSALEKSFYWGREKPVVSVVGGESNGLIDCLRANYAFNFYPGKIFGDVIDAGLSGYRR